jgi:hypothetical protein
MPMLDREIYALEIEVVVASERVLQQISAPIAVKPG